jgi:hypothetical protein
MGDAPGKGADVRPLSCAVLVAAAAALRLGAARRPSIVERLYSRGLHPRIAAGLGAVARLVPFAIAEPLALLAAIVLLALLARAVLSVRRGPPVPALIEAGVTALGLAGIVYLVFLLAWGLNYQRRPLATLAGLDPRPASSEELADLGAALVDEANRLRSPLSEDASGVMRLPAGTRGVLDRTRSGFDEAARRHPFLGRATCPPKAAVLSPLLSALGISGIYSPFTAEPLVNRELPDPDLPFSAAHEVAHSLGFAREDEANYLGSLACRLHRDGDFRYSGTLAATAYVLGALASVDETKARELQDRRTAGVRRDVAALDEWSVRHEGRLSRASRRVNDAYLRSQGEREGLRSYGRFVDLLVAERRAGAGPRRTP